VKTLSRFLIYVVKFFLVGVLFLVVYIPVGSLILPCFFFLCRNFFVPFVLLRLLLYLRTCSLGDSVVQVELNVRAFSLRICRVSTLSSFFDMG